jgi:acetyl esterase/lipase
MRRCCVAHLAILACLACFAGSSRADESSAPREETQANTYAVKAIKDVAYYDGEDADKVKHKLDLYLPKDKERFPVFFFVHGGAWVHGDKNFFNLYSSLGTYFAKQGIGVVVTNYRLSPGVKHPEHVKDVARAFAWTYKNIEKYGGRPDQIFAGGHSAGAHLSALLAADDTYLKSEGLSSDKIKGVIPISGMFQIPDKLLPTVFGTDEEVRRKASPMYHAKAGLPPFLILYADKDLPGCDKDQAEALGKALKDKGTKAATLEVKDSNHYLIILHTASGKGPAPQAILDFIVAQTKDDKKDRGKD